MTEAKNKVTAEHLKRKAYLYIRQSTLRQVIENTESTRRQYDLRQRAVALGWPTERIEVIDSDLARSGTSMVEREGFQKLVAEVGLGRAGIVMGLEVSRLARNCADWHRLLEICAMSGTLILDEDGIYDPTEFNDRMLLGLKGTMSEAETYLIRARLRGGILNKARRAELRTYVPIGLAYDEDGHTILDPDKQIQQSIRLIFETFLQLGTAHRVAKYFRDNGLLFPRKPSGSPRVIWGPLAVHQVLMVLHNPRYAGAYIYGRGHTKRKADGSKQWERLPREQWKVFVPDAYKGYISWQQHEQIERMIRNNALAYGIENHLGPPREGPALLQGRVVCGICGNRMSVRYNRRAENNSPIYQCHRNYQEHGEPVCQDVPGAGVDNAVGKALLEAMTPMAIEVSLAVEQEVNEKFEQADRLRLQQVERARYEMQCAQRRYMLVDPANRLVADSLEAEYNAKLHALAQAEDNYKQQREREEKTLDTARKKQLFSLTKNFPAIWNDPQTPMRERKRMVALLIEDVTLVKRENISINVRFKGGSTKSLCIPLPLNAWQGRVTPRQTVTLIDELLQHNSEAQVAKQLNDRGCTTGAGAAFSKESVLWVCEANSLKSYKQRLREQGMLTSTEMAKRYGVNLTTISCWRRNGFLAAIPYNDKGDQLYFPVQNHEGKSRRSCCCTISRNEK